MPLTRTLTNLRNWWTDPLNAYRHLRAELSSYRGQYIPESTGSPRTPSSASPQATTPTLGDPP
jgi:hypothetical protein